MKLIQIVLNANVVRTNLLATMDYVLMLIINGKFICF